MGVNGCAAKSGFQECTKSMLGAGYSIPDGNGFRPRIEENFDLESMAFDMMGRLKRPVGGWKLLTGPRLCNIFPDV
jgi:hypothetical protein